MGSGHSANKPLRTQADEADGQIDVDTLFSALHKLSCVFEIKESLMTDLIEEVTDLRHTNFDSQFFGLEEWIKKYADTDLSPPEMFALIQYVELYQPLPLTDVDQTSHSEDTPIERSLSAMSLSSETDKVCPLLCPYRSEVGSWTATIRRKELDTDRFRFDKTDRFKDDDTADLSRGSCSENNYSFNYDERFLSKRQRGDSNMSDLSM